MHVFVCPDNWISGDRVPRNHLQHRAFRQRGPVNHQKIFFGWFIPTAKTVLKYPVSFTSLITSLKLSHFDQPLSILSEYVAHYPDDYGRDGLVGTALVEK